MATRTVRRRRCFGGDGLRRARGLGSALTTPRVWQGILGIGVALGASVLLRPSLAVNAAVTLSAAVLSTVAVVVALAVRRPARADAWRLVALGLALSVVGLLTWRPDPAVPAPGSGFAVTVSDAVILSCYVVWGAAAWRMARRRDGDDHAALIDAGIVGIAGAMLVWLFLLNPYVALAHLTPAQRFTAIAFPMVDLLLMPLLARLVLTHGARIRAHLLLLAGLATLLVGDLLFGLGRLHGWYEPAGPLDAIYVVPYACVAAAAWHPSARVEVPHVEETYELSWRRLVALALAAITTPAVLLLQPSPGAATVRLAATATITVFLLVLLRMAGLVRRVDEQAAQLEVLSRTDPLTGAANRRVLDERLEAALAGFHREGRPFVFAMLDLDRFKAYNDDRGHPSGDALLVEVVRRWHRELRDVDLLARYGGEEFAVVLSNCELEAGRAVVERLRAAVPDGQTASGGLVAVAPGRDTPRDLVGEADRALYAAKRAGRDCIVVAPA